MKNRIYIALFVVMTFYSCGTTPCVDRSFSLAFVGFSITDIDTIKLTAYQPHTIFQNIMDSSIVIPKNTEISQSVDTLFIIYLGATSLGQTTKGLVDLSPRFDWQIYIPSKNKTVFLSDIKSPQTESHERACWNSIDSYVQDGELKQAVYVYKNFDYYYYIYINE